MEDLSKNSAKWVSDPAHSELTFKVILKAQNSENL